jgi:hypothetical protein
MKKKTISITGHIGTTIGSSNTTSIGNHYGYTINTIITPQSNELDISKTLEYIEYILKLLGIDLTYDEYVRMSEYERKSLLRDIKINKILK